MKTKGKQLTVTSTIAKLDGIYVQNGKKSESKPLSQVFDQLEGILRRHIKYIQEGEKHVRINISVEKVADLMELPKVPVRRSALKHFMMWAEEFYRDREDSNLNYRIPRKDVFKNYLENFPEDRDAVSPKTFREMLLAYCRTKGFKLNPQLYDEVTGLPLSTGRNGQPVTTDKIGGIEYFMVGN